MNTREFRNRNAGVRLSMGNKSMLTRPQLSIKDLHGNDFFYGKANRPSTPIKGIIGNSGASDYVVAPSTTTVSLKTNE